MSDAGTGAGTAQRRTWIRVLSGTETAIYTAAAAVLATLVVVVLVRGALDFARGLSSGDPAAVVHFLDQVLLMLMLVELLHTVGISLREHGLVAEPFLIVGLIAAIRRMLAITAEVGLPTAENAEQFRLVMLELGLLTLFLAVSVLALIALRRWGRRQWSGDTFDVAHEEGRTADALGADAPSRY